MDQLMLALRAKRGGECVDKQRILREMIRYRAEKQTVTIGLISDQKPRPAVTRTWVQFLHQETGFLDGGEVLGKKFDYPVFYAYITRPKRGYYRVVMQPISARPEQTKEGEITTAYAHVLERNIIEQPSLWLWSHNRWKHKKS
jgi:KDO2-lipid IV(A) lauroyltransferase